MEIDIERLRNDLINYFGTATNFFKVAYIDLFEVQNASDEIVIKIAIDNNFDLNNYQIDDVKNIKYLQK